MTPNKFVGILDHNLDLKIYLWKLDGKLATELMWNTLITAKMSQLHKANNYYGAVRHDPKINTITVVLRGTTPKCLQLVSILHFGVMILERTYQEKLSENINCLKESLQTKLGKEALVERF